MQLRTKHHTRALRAQTLLDGPGEARESGHSLHPMQRDTLSNFHNRYTGSLHAQSPFSACTECNPFYVKAEQCTQLGEWTALLLDKSQNALVHNVKRFVERWKHVLF